MQNDESRTDLGTIKIHKNVVASVASIAATEIEGVKRIGVSFRSSLLELLGKKDLSNIKVEFDKNYGVKIEVPLVIQYGYNIPEIANKAQENIRQALEKMTNLSIKDIDISIQSIEK
ncbi:MAG: Asp23/Gls24 family envelope stress response protein [Candidatus Omnitrophica bacterium]|nr:Asp23/Gls24 family envelope stress response protein [Candidatus Omnitrophota bacterium]